MAREEIKKAIEQIPRRQGWYWTAQAAGPVYIYRNQWNGKWGHDINGRWVELQGSVVYAGENPFFPGKDADSGPVRTPPRSP